MQGQDKHIIQKQVFEISTPALKQAQHWEREAGELVHAVIEPCLEATFNSLAGNPDLHFIIDRLELDLGVFSSGKFKSDLAARLRENLEKALHPYLQPVQSHQQAFQTARALEENPEEATTLSTGVLSDQDHLLNAFIFFLRKGRLPWWVVTPGFSFDNLTPEALTAIQSERVKRALRASANAKKRFVTTLSAQLLERWFIQMGIKEKISTAWNWLFAQVKSYPQFVPGFYYYWKLSWLDFLLNNSPNKPKLEEIIRSATDNDNAIQSEIILRIWECRKTEKAPAKSGIPVYIQDTLKHWASNPPAWLLTIISQKSRQKKVVDTIMDSFQEAPPEAEIPKPVIDTQPPKSRDADDIFINGAGLVMLHPFLVAFLKESGLEATPGFRSDEDRSRAVRLFSFLATGDEELPEYQLLLPKLLCNMAWETPLIPVPPFTEKEKTICNELLQAVINHWKALRNTTPDGLRGAFLQREGKLHPRNDGWLLEVERRPQDVLLSKLPWGVSLIKLPWMTEFLHVSWT